MESVNRVTTLSKCRYLFCNRLKDVFVKKVKQTGIKLFRLPEYKIPPSSESELWNMATVLIPRFASG